MEALTQAERIATLMGRYMGDQRRALIVTDDMASFAFYASSIGQMCRVELAENMEEFLGRLAGVQIVCVTVGNDISIDSLEIVQELRGNPKTKHIPFVLVGKVSLFRVPADQQWEREMRILIPLVDRVNEPAYVPFGPQSIFGEIVAGLVGWDWTVGDIDSIA